MGDEQEGGPEGDEPQDDEEAIDRWEDESPAQPPASDE